MSYRSKSYVQFETQRNNFSIAKYLIGYIIITSVNKRLLLDENIKSTYKKMMLLAKAQAFKATKSAGELAT